MIEGPAGQVSGNVRASVILLTVAALSVSLAEAQTRRISPSGGNVSASTQKVEKVQKVRQSSASVGAANDERIQTRADSMIYKKEKGIIEARGNVLIKKGPQELRADFIIINTVTEEADAYGNVVMKRGTEVWRGARLHYNFKLGVGDSDAMSYSAAPFRLKAGKVERMDGNMYRAKSAKVTTCVNGFDHAHFKVRAKEIVLQPGESMKGKHTVFFLGPIPFFYLPYWYRDLDDSSGWRFRAGYESKWGGYLLSSYRYAMGDVLKGETHVDYRSDRGVAAGQDFGWNTDTSHGAVELYYVNDDMPLDDEDDPAKDIDASRFRVKVKNTSALSDRDLLYLQGEVVSDVDMREDFFESEFRANVQPDNYIVYGHRGDSFTVDLLARMRLNDFYEGVNRIPEGSLNVLRQPLADSLLYYESQTYLSNLERVYAETSGSEEYSSARFDTAHMINYPGKYFGFLTAIPRVGARGTYYTATMQSSTVTNVTTDAASSLLQTNTVTTLSDGPGELRTRFEFGCETSFKAYKTWGAVADPRRHVVEPYANYTFVPEPSVTPDELYQFDSVDTLTDDHSILLGVRNKYQKKIGGMPFDLIDLNLYTVLLLDPEEEQDALSNFYFDGRLQPGTTSLATFDGYYDTDSSQLARFDARIEYNLEGWWQIGSEYHYAVDESSLISADVTFMPEHSWTWNVYGRYEAEAGRMEEEGGYIQRNMDCMSVRTRVSVLPGYTSSGGTEVDDEFRVMLEFWLRAFPEMRISAKHGG